MNGRSASPSGDTFSALIQDYDWVDEVLHARIGRDWYVKQIGEPRKAADYCDSCWSKVLVGWNSYRAQGRTQHENGWPSLYPEWGRVHGGEPDERVAVFATSYKAVRADLREGSGPGIAITAKNSRSCPVEATRRRAGGLTDRR